MADGTQSGRRGLLSWLKGRPTAPPQRGAPEGIERRFLDRMRDEGEIARGGMGSIRAVFDTNLRRRVALKLMDPGLAADPKGVQRFTDEAQITGQLDHPNIVPVYDFNADHEGTRFLAMKLVRGETLAATIEKAPPESRTWEETFAILQVFCKVCDAVAFAHARGVVHRDLKPANIMVGSFGQVYLMDWGIARLLHDKRASADDAPPVSTSSSADLDEPGSVIGSLHYMSSEQAHGNIAAVDERTDVFGLGAILYEILVGVPPIFQRTALETLLQAQEGAVPPPELMAPGLPVARELARVAMRALEKEKSDRYPSVLAMKADIETFLRGGGTFPTRVFAHGEPLMIEGEQGDVAFIITRGHVDIFKEAPSGRVHQARLGPGSVVGEAAVLTDRPRMATVCAADEVHAVEVDRKALEREIGVGSWVGALLRSLADRFRTADQRLRDTCTTLKTAQIAAWLFQYVALYGIDGRVRWSTLVDSAVTEFDVGSDDVGAVVTSIATLALDERNDTLSLVR